ncbi:thiolase [Burkholderia sp. SJ98]|nr:thiolase [Burkholderia sp. SJ98]
MRRARQGARARGRFRQPIWQLQHRPEPAVRIARGREHVGEEIAVVEKFVDAHRRRGARDCPRRRRFRPNGGLLSRGHPVGATGLAQIVELTQQLRGRAGARQRPDAKVALAEHNGGQLAGDSAVALVTILST